MRSIKYKDRIQAIRKTGCVEVLIRYAFNKI